MTIYRKYAGEFIKKLSYSIPLLVTAIMSFGFAITHSAVSIDDTSGFRYIDQHHLLYQGRFTGYLLDEIFDVMKYKPFIGDFIAVMLLVAAAVLWCALFKRVSGDKLHPFTYTAFSCLFVSYPLISEIFNYAIANILVCLGYVLTALSLMLAYEGFREKKFPPMILACVLMCLNVSGYESCAPVYVFGIFAILILAFLAGDRESRKWKTMLMNFFGYLSPLIVGVMAESLISKIIVANIHNVATNYAQTTILWGLAPTGQLLSRLVQDIFRTWFIPALYYLPFTILVLALLLSVVLLLATTIRYKNALIGLLFLGTIGSVFSLSLVSGAASPYRTCQVFAVFIAFVFMMAWQFISKLKQAGILKGVAAFFIAVIVIRQSSDLSKWFWVESMRYNEEITVMEQMALELESHYDIAHKPVVFIGYYTTSDNINQYTHLRKDSWSGKMTAAAYEKFFKDIPLDSNPQQPYYFKYTQTTCNSFLNWGTDAFAEMNTELLKYFKMHGYSFIQGTPQMKQESIKDAAGRPDWPKVGSIFETESHITVIM